MTFFASVPGFSPQEFQAQLSIIGPIPTHYLNAIVIMLRVRALTASHASTETAIKFLDIGFHLINMKLLMIPYENVEVRRNLLKHVYSLLLERVRSVV